MDEIFSDIAPLIGDTRYRQLRNVLSPSFATISGEDLTGALNLLLRGLHNSSDSKRVLLLFTDGGNNASSQSWTVVRRALAKVGVQLVVVSYTENDRQGGDNGEFQETLSAVRSLAERTGGLFVEALKEKDWPATISRILSPYRLSYVVGFYPSESTPDQLRRLSLACQPARLQIRMRSEYLSE